MLEITIPATELIDQNTLEFISIKETKLQLEHSLLSISKWESRHCKPFLGDGSIDARFTGEEYIDYIKDMTLTKNVDPMIYYNLSPANQILINEYINAPMTATTFSNTSPTGGSKQVMTAELIYWEMIALGIPFECQKWHFNRLMTLIRVCSIKQSKPEKMSHKENIAQRRALNAKRKAKHHSRG